MPRATLVRISPEQGQILVDLALRHHKDILDASPAFQQLINQVREEVLNDNDVPLWIERAVDLYSTDDLEVDDDAPFSRTDIGVWVGAWVWVPFSQEDEPDE